MDRDYAIESIIDALDEAYGGDTDSDDYALATCLKWLYQETKARDFQYRFDRLCREKNVCPECCEGHLKQVVIGSEQLDCFGSYCWHDEYATVCDNCGREF